MNRYLSYPVVLILLLTGSVFFSIGYNYGCLVSREKLKVQEKITKAEVTKDDFKDLEHLVGKETKEVKTEPIDDSPEVGASEYKSLQSDMDNAFKDYPILRERYLSVIKSKMEDGKVTKKEYEEIVHEWTELYKVVNNILRNEEKEKLKEKFNELPKM